MSSLKLDLVTECRAARTLGVTVYTFKKLVRVGALPKPWRGSNLWSMAALQRAVDAGNGEGRSEARA